MENYCWSNNEQNILLRELIEGMETAKQLRIHLNHSGSSMETKDDLIRRILSSYEKSLSIINFGQHRNSLAVVPADVVNVPVLPESPISRNGSPGSDDFDGSTVDFSKKRKTMPRWTDHVRVSPENGLEGPHDDGYSWRKYGQKDILGAKYPRSYYRCTYRNTQNCWAMKQVQRTDEDPTVFEITYRGVHTCSHGQQQPPTSPEKQDQKQNSNNYQQLQQQSNETLFNFQKTLKVNTDNLDNTKTAFPFSFLPTYGSTSNHSPSFISPTTPEPSHFFQTNNFQTNNFDAISATTSASNSPLVEPDFSLLALELDPNFPFGTPGFFC